MEVVSVAGKLRGIAKISRTSFLSIALLASAAYGQGFKIAQISPPGATFAQAAALNNKGTVVGLYNDSTGATIGFSFASGKYTKIVFPGSVNFTTSPNRSSTGP